MPLPNIPKLALTRNQIIIAGSILGAIVAIVLFVLFFGSGSSSKIVPISLTAWGTDQKSAFEGIVNNYHALRPNVTVTYVQIGANNYDETVLNALAAGTGPDVFMIGNHDVRKKLSLLAPAAATQMTASQMDALFPAAVAQDFAVGGKAYAMPLYMDTLSLVYNKESFDQAGIATPPVTWQDFDNDIAKLRVISPSGQILKAAAGIGGSEKSVRHAVDILNLLMMQNGVQMVDANGRASFAASTGGTSANSLKFYLQFVDSGSPLYTWNDSQQDSLESFLQGNTAMAFAYSADIATFKDKSPFLNFGVAPVPQVSKEHAVNYPSYQGLAVALRSTSTAWAWDFVNYASASPDAIKSYLVATNRAPAPRSMIESAAALTARSWAMPDYAKVRNIFNAAITSVLSGAAVPDSALTRAQDQINQL